MEVDERRPRSTGDLPLISEDKPELPITSVSLPASPSTLAPPVILPPIPIPTIGKRKLSSPIPPPPLPEKCSLPQQFCLKWNNYQTNLTNVFDNLLQNESFVDVTLACDGQSIKAHKMVLSACSPYFQALFYENPCQHPIVIMRDVKWPELKAVIEFMYKGEINIDREKIAPLLRVAEMLQIRGLAEVGGEVAHVAAQSSKKMRISEPNLTVSVGGGAGVTESSVSGNKRVHKRRNSHSPSMECVQAEILTTTPLLPLHSNFEDDEEEDEDDECDDEVVRLKEKQSLPQVSKISVRNLNPSPITGHPLSSPSKSATLKQQQHHHHHQHPHQHSLPPPASSSSSSSSSSSAAAAAAPSSSSSSSQQQSSTTAGVTTPFNLAVTPPEVINLGMGVNVGVGASVGPGGAGRGDGVSIVGPNGPSGEEFMRAGGGNVNRGLSHVDDMEIKPEIAEMIREEERAKLLESSNPWLSGGAGAPGAPPPSSSVAESYQYQLQSMWQKCWNTNQQNLIHQLRFRERGPLKSWRPEAMAEAIFSVLREGLSLSQAARKYDIPYPTFVLYANRVHNMLGPSLDGGVDPRPKARGRPQRILLGMWPEELIKSVIKAVVFRDYRELKDEGGQHLLPNGSPSPHFPMHEGLLNYPPRPNSNGYPPNAGKIHPPSPTSEANSAQSLANLTENLRRQMSQMQQSPGNSPGNFFGLQQNFQRNNSEKRSNSNESPKTPVENVGEYNPLGFMGIPGLHIIPQGVKEERHNTNTPNTPKDMFLKQFNNSHFKQHQQKLAARTGAGYPEYPGGINFEALANGMLHKSGLSSVSPRFEDFFQNHPVVDLLNSTADLENREPPLPTSLNKIKMEPTVADNRED